MKRKKKNPIVKAIIGTVRFILHYGLPLILYIIATSLPFIIGFVFCTHDGYFNIIKMVILCVPVVYVANMLLSALIGYWIDWLKRNDIIE